MVSAPRTEIDLSWYLLRKGQDKEGPYTEYELREMYLAGELSLDDKLVKKGSPVARKASEVIKGKKDTSSNEVDDSVLQQRYDNQQSYSESPFEDQHTILAVVDSGNSIPVTVSEENTDEEEGGESLFVNDEKTRLSAVMDLKDMGKVREESEFESHFRDEPTNTTHQEVGHVSIINREPSKNQYENPTTIAESEDFLSRELKDSHSSETFSIDDDPNSTPPPKTRQTRNEPYGLGSNEIDVSPRVSQDIRKSRASAARRKSKSSSRRSSKRSSGRRSSAKYSSQNQRRDKKRGTGSFWMQMSSRVDFAQKKLSFSPKEKYRRDMNEPNQRIKANTGQAFFRRRLNETSRRMDPSGFRRGRFGAGPVNKDIIFYILGFTVFLAVVALVFGAINKNKQNKRQQQLNPNVPQQQTQIKRQRPNIPRTKGSTPKQRPVKVNPPVQVEQVQKPATRPAVKKKTVTKNTRVNLDH